jgi:predicted TIM-barrel fold metal-dependent hydrolase
MPQEAPRPPPRRLVDVHMHYLPACYREALDRAGLMRLDGGMPVPAWSEDLALQTMDRIGIETALLSVSSPSIRFVAGETERRLCRDVNLAGADLVHRRPDRFGLFVTIPLPDVEAALAEIAFGLDELGMDGVIIETNIRGVYLGDDRLAPVFDELNRRKATVFLHPTSPACFESVGLGRPAPMIEFPMDTTRSVVDLIYSGTLRRCPDIKMIVPHGGGVLPSLVHRIAAFATRPFMNQRLSSEAEVFDTLAKLYYDVVQSGHEAALYPLRKLAPTSQLLFGSDWPFGAAEGVERNLQRLTESLTEAEICDVVRNNAHRLFPRLAPSGPVQCTCGAGRAEDGPGAA